MDFLSIKEFLDDIAWLKTANSLHILLYGTSCVTFAIEMVSILSEDVNKALRVNLLILGNLDCNIIEIFLKKHAQFHLGVFFQQLVDTAILKIEKCKQPKVQTTINLCYQKNGAPLSNNPHNRFDGGRECDELVLDVKHSHRGLLTSLL